MSLPNHPQTVPSYETTGVLRSPEEDMLVAFHHGAYDLVHDDLQARLAAGKSPNVLAVVRPELLFGLAEHMLAGANGEAAETVALPAIDADNGRWTQFAAHLRAAEAGDPAAISTLPKFVTTPDQLAYALQLALEHREAVADWRSERPCVQLIGSFNPQHIGHRATMRAALTAAGERASVTAQLVADHPVKKDSLPPYDGRYRGAEYFTYRSTQVDPTRVTILDVPVGPELAKNGAAQIELLADVTGDPEMRWLMGSDKFMSDVRTAREGQLEKRAITRFREPRMHLYVGRRATHPLAELQAGIDFVQERFGTSITLVEEPADEAVLAAAASHIRALREEGRHREADAMQLADIVEPLNRPVAATA